jgi:hypothetical protein
MRRTAADSRPASCNQPKSAWTNALNLKAQDDAIGTLRDKLAKLEAARAGT